MGSEGLDGREFLVSGVLDDLLRLGPGQGDAVLPVDLQHGVFDLLLRGVFEELLLGVDAVDGGVIFFDAVEVERGGMCEGFMLDANQGGG